MDNNSSLAVVVLAAGKGTRMKSARAKVLHEVFYVPMVHHVLGSIESLRPDRSVVIIGHQGDAVEQSLEEFQISSVTQKEQLGTGHAVLVAEPAIPKDTDTVMILCGDTPLVRPEMLEELLNSHIRSATTLTILTTRLDNPTNYGRILTDNQDRVTGIVEEKDASDEQRKIREINTGIYCVDRKFLFDALQQVGTDNSQGEVYLTDIVGIAVNAGHPVKRYLTPYSGDVLGVNSRVELAQAHQELQKRRNEAVMLQGVTMQHPATTIISPQAVIGQDSTLMPGVRIHGKSRIGRNATVMDGAVITNCIIGDNVVIGPYSVLSDCTVADNSTIPPHSTSI